MRLTVFYSWQSDRPSALCRQFIRIALDDAAKRLAARRSVEVIVDADTEGVPGTPPITETILQKIKACDVFVADVSFVAETAEGKRLPNPNVMGEFGYALSEKGWRRILLVMNTAFGPAGDLPFDLGHFRKPAAYEVASEKPDSPRRTAREALSARLEANLEAVLDDILATAPATRDLWQPLQDLWVSTQNARVANNPPCLVSQPSAYVYVVPAAALDAPRIDLRAVQAERRLLLPEPDADARIGQDNTQWWAHGPTRRIEGLANPEADWCARLLRPGVIEHLFTLGRAHPGDQEIVVNGFTLEKRIVTRVDRSLAFLKALGLSGPSLVVVSLYELADVHLTGRGHIGRFRQPTFSVRSTLVPDGSLKAGDHLREVFDQLWLAAGLADGSLSFSQSDEWAGYAPGSAY